MPTIVTFDLLTSMRGGGLAVVQDPIFKSCRTILPGIFTEKETLSITVIVPAAICMALAPGGPMPGGASLLSASWATTTVRTGVRPHVDARSGFRESFGEHVSRFHHQHQLGEPYDPHRLPRGRQV